MTDQPVIHWFRRDLRLTDNSALNAALATGKPVITVFVFDDRILNSQMVGTPRMAFMLNALDNLQTAVWKAGGRLLFIHDTPEKALLDLIRQTGATAVYCNRDYTPYAKRRDDKMQEVLSVPLHICDDALIMQPGTVMTNNGDPYTVYTPFKKKWRSNITRDDYAVDETPASNLYRIQNVDTHDLPSLADLGFKSFDVPAASENRAQQRLEAFTDGIIYDYDERRNELTLDPFEENGGTSQLSPYFRLGILSPRQAFTAAAKAGEHAPNEDAKASVTAWADELIWREFYTHVMAHYPHVYTSNFNATYDNLEWQHDPDGLSAWKNGETGYPIIDAAMRQLKAVGWLPNRVRMIVSSFLTKDQLIDWREGERHFMQYLIDGDPAANNGGWQWAAGTGTDAQPYFRIFNPVSQSKKFDPTGSYIRRWVPELADINDDKIHEPWKLRRPPKAYPEPILDHKMARERTLEAFKKARDS
jgi:deoxyribodipyrimidine photo-lyase